MRRVLSLLSFCLVFGLVGDVQSVDNKIPLEVLFGNPEKVLPQISPDGKKLGFLAPDENNALNVWVRDLDSCKEELLTKDKRGFRAFFWRYDSQAILYLQDQEGNENTHLYQTDIKTKKTEDLTPFENIQATAIAYEPSIPDEILCTMNRRDRTVSDVYRINLRTKVCTLEVENLWHAIDFKADHNLQVRSSLAYDAEGRMIVRIRDDVTSPWRELMRWSSEDSGDLLSFSQDGKYIFMETSQGSNTVRLVKVNCENGTMEVIAEDPQYDFSDAELLVHPITRVIQAIRVNKEKPHWIVLDPSVKADVAYCERPGETLSIIDRDLKDEYWVIKYSSDRILAHYYLFDKATKKMHFLFSAQPKLEKYTLSLMTPISFKARDGLTLEGYLTLPEGKEAKNLPAVCVVHGGPWARDSWRYSPLVQMLANRGYAVLQINFRGSTGYGKQFLNAGRREWGEKMHTDILDGKQWLVDQHIANPKKVAIYGGSYGGYETLVALTFTPEAFCCGIDLFGPSNLITLLETLPPYWSVFSSKFNTFVGNIQTEKEFLKSRSPLFKVNQICRPLLIIQGANDVRVKQSEGDQIVEAMRKNDKPVEYIVFPNEGHGFVRPENSLKAAALGEAFLHKYLDSNDL